MEFVSALTIGTEAIDLVSALAKPIESAKIENSDPSLYEVLRRLPIEAVRLSRGLENRL